MKEYVLLTNGCSMCYGSDLTEDHLQRMKSCWSGKLGKAAGFDEVVNLGYPGGSNDRILRTTIEWIIQHYLNKKIDTNSLLVCIGWTSPMRREFYIDDEWRQLIPYHDYKDSAASFLNRVYRETAWHENESAIRFATQLISLQSFLKHNNISYVFFDAINSFQSINKDCNNLLDNYISAIDSSHYLNFSFPKSSMADILNTAAEHSPQRHPNEVEHQKWSEQLYDFIKSKKIATQILRDSREPKYNGTLAVTIRDKKIGLSKKPPKLDPSSFQRINATTNEQYLTKDKKNILKKILSARKKDPFIYE